MNSLRHRFKSHYLKYHYDALVSCVFFFLAGRVLLPHLGVQNDEALFAAALFDPRSGYAIKIGHSRLPIMLLSYLGAFKSWIYAPIFHIFGTGISAMRDPVLLAGVASVWLFYLLMLRVAGRRAAVIGCGLLAVDSLYLITVCFDWGPVALQHLLLISGLLLLMRFHQTPGWLPLAGAGFLLGLGMWDKALAIWMLSGIGIAGILTFPRQILAAINLRRVAIAALAFSLGALPLIIYNYKQNLATFRGNVSYDTSDFPNKARLLLATADGRGLFSWLNFEDWQTHNPRPPKGLIQTASARISAFAGHPRHNLTLWAFCLALLLAPLARGNAWRAILFALIAMLVAWLQMAVTANAGGSVHHAILIWPFPQIVIGVSFASASRRLPTAGIPALAVVLATMMVSGALVTNEYFTLAIRNGGGQNWTDAIFRLSDYMKGVSSEYVFCMDWGILDSLRLLNQGSLKLRVGTEPIARSEWTAEDREYLLQMISGPGNIFISHAKDFEFFAGVNDKLVKYAAGAGFERQILAVIPDSNRRPVYEVYRYWHTGGVLGH
ncbi:MAG TPA: glycosyltransferase family 39 protein [Candidatus Acidoferrales bacterium]|nr:glycosyltransferase family 39 protein [Candidatus Acidoferrales bacterium]